MWRENDDTYENYLYDVSPIAPILFGLGLVLNFVKFQSFIF